MISDAFGSHKSRIRRLIQQLFHLQTAPAIVVFHGSHVSPDQLQPAPADCLDSFCRTAVGNFVRFIARAFIAHFGMKPFLSELALHVHQLVGILLVTVTDRIADRFF